MAYVKNIWVDQEVERPRTYQKIDNADGSFTLIDDFGLVSELGTPVNADNMNHIEDGIEAGSFTKYDGSATYFENDLVTSFLDKDLVIYKSLKDNNVGNPLTDANYWEEISLGGGGMPIGTIYALNCTKDYVPEGSLPCDGTEYTKGQFPSLWDNYLTSEETEIVPIGVNLLGSFNNENGIVSGTGQISYSLLPEIWNGEDCELVYKFIADDITSTQKIFEFISRYWISIIDGVIGVQIEGADHFTESSSIGYYTASLTSNEFYIKLSYSYSWSISVSMNNSDWTTLVDAETWSVYTTPPINIGTSGKYLGQVDLTQSYWKNLETNKTVQFATERQKSLLNTCTYDEYTTELATYGQCAKFAIDTDNLTFKVPTIKDGAVIQQALSDSELGKAYNAGLPNITGGFLGDTELTDENGLYWDGAFTYTSIKKYRTGSTSGRSVAEGEFDASLSNPIYGNSDTVQMNAVALRHFVVVANGSINQSQMNWSQWASNLQGKMNADHSNDLCPYVKEMYQNGTSWYVLYSNGWCMQGFRVASQTQSKQVAYTLLKTMRDTNYSAMFTENAGTGACYQTKVYPTSTTQITVMTPSGGGMGGGFVEVCGYTL